MERLGEADNANHHKLDYNVFGYQAFMTQFIINSTQKKIMQLTLS